MHRSTIAAAAICLALGRAASFAASYESAYPYDVRVTAPQAVLRCGPGDEFYVTERPSRGDVLSVYRQRAGGWLAVRPTETSYSLLAARYVRGTDEPDVAEVTDDHAVSWVGSPASPAPELRWQVRLKPGERVVVLGEETLQVYPGGPRELHYRIAPPAGEFRWIHATHVRHASQPREAASEPRQDVTLTDFRVVIPEAEDEPARDGFVARRPRAADPGVANPRAEATGTAEPARLASRAERDPIRAARDALRDRDLPPLDNAEFERQFRDLDVQLSLMVTRPVSDWELDDLLAEANRLVGQGPSTVDRARAQLLAAKMDEFAQLHARYQTTVGQQGPLEGASDPAPVAGQASAAPTVDPRFDAAGWLYPVHSRNQASPPYALLDAEGAILQFVSPAPGLNLHRYLREEIGIFGQHATNRRLDKPHVTAQRVVSLKRHRR